MYYIHKSNDVYCLRTDYERTLWFHSLEMCVSTALTIKTTEKRLSKGTTLIYSGPTIPTPKSHPELFL